LDLLTPEAAKEVYERAKRMGLDVEGVKKVKVKRMSREAFETRAPKRRGKTVRKAIDRMSELERDKYALDNVEQCEQLATDLQYLVGRQYYDDEN
jgi:predicted transcriptional regulator